MDRVLDIVAPARLGARFRLLVASSWSSNLGDGMALAAGPLLVASQTDDAFLVALAATLQWLPHLLFGLHAGAFSDRHHRGRLVIAANLSRIVVLVVLVLSIVTGSVSVPIVLVALFLVATAEVFADNASATLLPMLVPRDDLPLANARIMAGFVTVNQLAGPPIGAALFAAGMAFPFVAEAVVVGFAVVLVRRISLPAHGREPAVASRIRDEIVEGLRWVRHHAAVRTLVLTIFTFNITYGAAWSVIVLYSSQRLGLGEVGFGLITTVIALGGIVGTLGYTRLTARLRLSDIMRLGLIIETLTHLGLALTTSPLVAMPIFFVFGAHAFVWGTTSSAIRQRAVPLPLQGRVGSVNTVGTFGGLVLGSLLGGALGQAYGVVAAYWFAFAGSAVLVVLIWRELRHIAHADQAMEAPTAVQGPG
ncbi:MAG: MFS transporter [Chloroflexi bacterium]|nr:MFS transporter [Chloroflexota bacterium]